MKCIKSNEVVWKDQIFLPFSFCCCMLRVMVRIRSSARFLALLLVMSLWTLEFFPMAVEAQTIQRQKKKSSARTPAVSRRAPVARKNVSSAKTPLQPTGEKGAPTRCLTASMKALYIRAQKQMEKDIATHGSGNEKAVELYKTKLATSWAAMSEPYCGYGSRGVGAVKKSLMKSINRIRAEFLKTVTLQSVKPFKSKSL